MDFPKTLDEWDYDIIKELVDSSYYETDLFDFKADLQPAEHLEKVVSAFANTNGGFLIFGVRDLNKPNRLPGVDGKKDFAKLLQDKIQGIEPNIYFKMKQPPINLPDSSNVIHVCFIPQSSSKPHLTRQKEFYKRSSGGSNVQMSYNEIRESFYGFEQRKIKVEMLALELGYLKMMLSELVVPENEISEKISPLEPNTKLLVELLGQVYPVIKDNGELMKWLLIIRSRIDVLNKLINRYMIQSSYPLINQEKLRADHNKLIAEKVKEGIPFIEKALEFLHTNYGFKLFGKNIELE